MKQITLRIFDGSQHLTRCLVKNRKNINSRLNREENSRETKNCTILEDGKSSVYETNNISRQQRLRSQRSIHPVHAYSILLCLSVSLHLHFTPTHFPSNHRIQSSLRPGHVLRRPPKAFCALRTAKLRP